MKYTTGLWIVACVCALVIAAAAQDAVEPVTISFNSIRGQDRTAVNTSQEAVDGNTVLFTNCSLYSDTSGVTTQGLDGVTVEVTVGNSSTSAVYYGVSQSRTDGQWWLSFVLTTGITTDILIEIQLTDTNSSTYTYPVRALRHRSAL